MWKPSPELAPVTTAVLPVRSGIASAVQRVSGMAVILACLGNGMGSGVRTWQVPGHLSGLVRLRGAGRPGPAGAPQRTGAYSEAVTRKPARGSDEPFGADPRTTVEQNLTKRPNPSKRKVADAVVSHLLRVGIDGGGNLASAGRSAERALAKSDDPEAAIDRIVATHTRLAAAGGFVTGLGGFVTLPVALPANVLGFYVIATRMVASIAKVRGHDISEDAVRTTVLLTLTGSDASKVVRHAGIGVDGVAAYALRSVSPAVLMVVNKGVAFRLFVQLGRHGISRFGHVIPVVGGLVGAAFDAMLMRRIAHHAREHFPQLPASVPMVRPRPPE